MGRLWDLKPQILLAGGHSIGELVTNLERAAQGGYYRGTPHHKSKLTRRERDVLRLCAMSFSNEQIAKVLGIEDRTVKNNLTTIFSKLHLKHRSQAILYYWGLWHWLTPEPQITY